MKLLPLWSFVKLLIDEKKFQADAPFFILASKNLRRLFRGQFKVEKKESFFLMKEENL